MLKYILLGFLNFQSYTGYDLHQRMEKSTSHFWHAKLSQIYTTLKKLEADGLVTSKMQAQADRPDKRIYHITQDGQYALVNWLAQPQTDIEQIKSKAMLRLFFGGMNDLEAVLTELKYKKARHEQKLADYRTVSIEVIDEAEQRTPNGSYHRVFWDATRDFGEQYEMMVIKWLEETIQQLTQLQEKETQTHE